MTEQRYLSLYRTDPNCLMTDHTNLKKNNPRWTSTPSKTCLLVYCSFFIRRILTHQGLLLHYNVCKAAVYILPNIGYTSGHFVLPYNKVRIVSARYIDNHNPMPDPNFSHYPRLYFACVRAWNKNLSIMVKKLMKRKHDTDQRWHIGKVDVMWNENLKTCLFHNPIC